MIILTDYAEEKTMPKFSAFTRDIMVFWPFFGIVFILEASNKGGASRWILTRFARYSLTP